jgi:hypothetical protein
VKRSHNTKADNRFSRVEPPIEDFNIFRLLYYIFETIGKSTRPHISSVLNTLHSDFSKVADMTIT